MWPTTADDLIAVQQEVAHAAPALWSPPAGPLRVGACWVCFPRGMSGPGAAGDSAWVAGTIVERGRLVARCVITGEAAAPYVPGLLAARAGGLLEQAVRALPEPPHVLLVDATGRDHPRRCGLALHLGAVVDLPSVGVTHRPLIATGAWPPDRAGATADLRIGDEVVGRWLRTRAGTRPLAVHPGWRLDPSTAVEVVSESLTRRRTPEPLRQARRVARRARAGRG